MQHARTDYEIFEQSSVTNRRLLREEELILDVTEALIDCLRETGMTKTELARRLGKTKGFVSQVLSGGRNLTLRTLADFADALECRVHFQVGEARASLVESPRVQIVRGGRWSSQHDHLRLLGMAGQAQTRVALLVRGAA